MTDSETFAWSPARYHDAKLETRHITPFVPVGRTTVSAWLNARATPHRLIDDRMARMDQAVEEALKDAALPVESRGLSRGEYDRRIHAVLARYLDAIEQSD